MTQPRSTKPTVIGASGKSKTRMCSAVYSLTGGIEPGHQRGRLLAAVVGEDGLRVLQDVLAA